MQWWGYFWFIFLSALLRLYFTTASSIPNYWVSFCSLRDYNLWGRVKLFLIEFLLSTSRYRRRLLKAQRLATPRNLIRYFYSTKHPSSFPKGWSFTNLSQGLVECIALEQGGGRCFGPDLFLPCCCARLFPVYKARTETYVRGSSATKFHFCDDLESSRPTSSTILFCAIWPFLALFLHHWVALTTLTISNWQYRTYPCISDFCLKKANREAKSLSLLFNARKSYKNTPATHLSFTAL